MKMELKEHIRIDVSVGKLHSSVGRFLYLRGLKASCEYVFPLRERQHLRRELQPRLRDLCQTMKCLLKIALAILLSHSIASAACASEPVRFKTTSPLTSVQRNCVNSAEKAMLRAMRKTWVPPKDAKPALVGITVEGGKLAAVSLKGTSGSRVADQAALSAAKAALEMVTLPESFPPVKEVLLRFDADAITKRLEQLRSR